MQTMQKPRMTINEVCDDMRSRGLGLSQYTISNGIADGIFPFGKIVATHPHRRTFLILRKDYEEWADQNIGPIL